MSTSARTPLVDLLDVSTLQNHEQISSRFSQIAESILLYHCLRVEHEGTSTEFDILEVEFYLWRKNVHEDPFCHAHDDQINSGKWYFHRVPRSSASPVNNSNSLTEAGGYRGGTRKGLDLTFGSLIKSPFFSTPQNPSSQVKGGILFRSMRPRDGSGAVISGPSLLVDKLLSITKSRNIAELVGIKLDRSISALPSADISCSAQSTSHLARLYLTSPSWKSNLAHPIVHRSPRVGLDLSHSSVVPHRSHPRVLYISKLYRFFISPEVLKSNGRHHTLLGLFLQESGAEGLSGKDSVIVTRLAELTGLKQSTIEKYIEDYNNGIRKRSLTEYTGPNGKGASSNAQSFMRLMGVLHRMGLLGADDSASTLED